VTSIIGSGWLLAALFAAQIAGGASVLAWAIAAVLIMVLALNLAELGAMFPVTGGTARYPQLAFGSAAGISFGLFSFVQAVTVAPLECFAIMKFASYFWPGLFNTQANNLTRIGFVLVIVLMAVFVAVNFLAVRTFAQVNNFITWWKVAIPVLAIIVLLTKFHGGNFTAGGQAFMPGGIKALLQALPNAGIVYAYLGFEQANQLAGEIKNPARNVPLAIIISVLVAATIYCFVQIAFIGAMPTSLLGHGFAGIGRIDNQSAPLVGVAAIAGFGWLATLLRIDGFISPAGVGLIYTTGTSRISYALARNRYFPQVFAQVDKNGIPWAGLIFTYIIGLFLLLPFEGWESLVALISSASLLMYAGAPLALGAFRTQAPEALRVYRLPSAFLFAPVAFVIADLLIYWSGFEVIWKLGVVLVIGYLAIGAFMISDPQRQPLNWRSAVWLPVWLIGMGIISWQGQFSGGPQTASVNTKNIPFGWDMLVVAAFSLFIYYWAMSAKLTREQMLREVNSQAEEILEDLPAVLSRPQPRMLPQDAGPAWPCCFLRAACRCVNWVM
jgi:amino acid transporter